MDSYQEGGITIRPATEKDVPTILKFILELAEFEGAADQIQSTEEGLQEVLFQRKGAEALICEMEQVPIGFAIWAYSFSTFTGKQTLYIDDIYIQQPFRGRGIGSKIFSWLAGVAFEKDCARMDWYCMETNVAGKEYYKKIGAEEIDWFRVYRFNREKIEAYRRTI
ncbi:GNAT family N-acetyltransferase [Sinanaerobacter chloroacetimidivorans]|jgi:ribosomal protein S18 acetylase RimI-like enzyme|uniref:GNAT family N-acetyltransferase n=1 Tax=Sinanaerobacter chloroacetimidivorans TaxID=2818044 RepID=A0A8J8B230_9FIRM|nr:GNAT family N-acetyltransferase [Sinanaerobacter chloroacetimidivorans]MBR0598316.1 GNAT family N-acetyltransferase [Sinanaerobacter chloroacetimidivorans]